jgi:2-methylcitrate synthase
MSTTHAALPADYKKGLEGVIAGTSSICTVGRDGDDLHYRGYSVVELEKVATFEEVACMLLTGDKPTPEAGRAFTRKVAESRHLPKPLAEVLDRIPGDAHPMDVLRTGISFLGVLEPEEGKDPVDVAARLIGVAPTISAYWWRVSHGEAPVNPDSYQGLDQGGFFLHALRGTPPDEFERRLMNTSLILYAEHGFNASTFAARVCTSTRADMHGACTAAVATLKGNLHGGANEAAMEMILPYRDPDHAEAEVMDRLRRKELIMGFGHRVYKVRDPRNEIMREHARELAQRTGRQHLLEIFLRVEQVMKREKKMFANADFYHAYAYYVMGIPIPLYTPIFVFSRLSGWCAHILEQRADNRLIRPTEAYVGPEPRKWA